MKFVFMAVDVRYGIEYGMIKKHKVQIFLIELTKTLPQNFQCDGRHCRFCRIDSPAPLAHLILSGHFRTTCGGSRRSSTTWPATRRSSSSLPSSRTISPRTRCGASARPSSPGVRLTRGSNDPGPGCSSPPTHLPPPN